ncbi:hypothetical protein NDU88_005991 [Pleurodeles waltl]|uniref:Uncharacterized protein n=1 Tax=Pleurodeles waltl TaxID=8319 RepID=A0AAV7SNG7_PLEWA|nr:hypothetical protein NDU88_005991 [Pleurodeles waltl]
MQLDFARKGLMRRLRCDRNFDARPTRLTHSRPGTTQPDFRRGNRHSACSVGEISRTAHRNDAELVRSPGFHTQTPGV